MEYTVVYSSDYLKQVEALTLAALAHGQGGRIEAAVAEILGRLARDPFQEEVLYSLSNQDPVAHVVCKPVSVWATINIDHRLVWLVRIDRLAGEGE